jgi:signal transduction histidine kinase/CheY-like chemotaxis protein
MPPRASPLRALVENAAVAALLVGASQAGLALALAPRGPYTVVWPSPGVAVAALVLLGLRVWPGVLLGSIAAMLVAHVPVAATLVVAGLQGAVMVAGAALLLRRQRFSMRRLLLRDALAFVGVSIGVSLLRALVRVISIALMAPPDPGTLPSAATRFFILALGDLLGLLLLGGALLAWLSWPASRPPEPDGGSLEQPRPLELLALASCTAVTTAALFGGIAGVPSAPSFLLVPMLLWGGLRFGVRGATLVSLISAALSLYLTHHGRGPVSGDPLLMQVLQMQVFLGVASGAGLIFAAAWTERDWVATQARRSAARYRSLVDGLPDGLLRLDADDKVLDLVARTGPLQALVSTAVGRPLAELLGIHTAAPLLHAVAEARSEGRAVQCSLQLLGPDEPRDMECSVSPSEGGEVTVLARDVTELRKLQTQVLLSDRLAAVGSLAAGVAHEINNPLAFVTADLELIGATLAQAPAGGLEEKRAELRDLVQESLGGTARIARVVRDLRTFATRGTEEREPIDLALLLDDCAALASNELRHRARLVRDFERVPQVLGSAAALGQVFLNLILNAAQSIPEGAAESNEVRLKLRSAPGGAVEVEVRNTGAGVAPEHLSRIFDPFFSTKPVGSGAGLGLAVCHRLVAAAGGQISLESSPGQGTRVRVRLPLEPPARAMSPLPGMASAVPMSRRTPLGTPSLSPLPAPRPAPLFATPLPEGKPKPPSIRAVPQLAALPAAPPAPAAPVAPPPAPAPAPQVGSGPLQPSPPAASGRARLLVVDDEPLVARSLVRMLGGEHDVEVAASVAEARARLGQAPAVDAVLSDLMMPDGTGMDLFEWLGSAHPALARRVIFMTGGAFTDAATAFLARVPNRRLEKPFVPAEVRSAVREALQQPL